MRAEATALEPGLEPAPARAGARGSGLGDRLWTGGLHLLAGGILIVAGAILYVLVKLSQPSWQATGVFEFLRGRGWDPVSGSFGALPFIYGTLVTSAVALLLAVPVALGSALFLSELAPRQARPALSFCVEMLSAIPSVVYGLWGLAVLVPWLRSSAEPFLKTTLGFLPLFQGPAFGSGLLAGGIILAIMILPTITSVAGEVIKTVPQDMREAALALGATPWETVTWAVVPHVRSGVVGAILLGLGRALGETMAVTMVIGNSPEIHASLLAPGYSLPAVIANEFAEATDAHHTAALAALGLVLFGITLLLNAGARVLVRRSGAPS